MRIISYGDSFTVGLGTDIKYEESLLGKHPRWEQMSATEKNIQRKLAGAYRFKNNFTAFLSKKLKVENLNEGSIGCNNYYILDKIVSDFTGGIFDKKDLVLVNFTSSLRNYPTFFPHFFSSRPHKGIDGITFGETEFEAEHRFDTTTSGDIKQLVERRSKGRATPIYEFIQEYKLHFIKSTFNFKYIDYINQNIIIFLQQFFKTFEINYIMFDAFDSMFNNQQYDFSRFINQETYWGFGEKTIWSFLSEFNDDTLLEYTEDKVIERKLHPSKKGHELFANELYKKYKELYGKPLI